MRRKQLWDSDRPLITSQNKFQPLDLSVNKAAKAFIQNKYNEWFAGQVSMQLRDGIDPIDVKISSKISDLKTIACELDSRFVSLPWRREANDQE